MLSIRLNNKASKGLNILCIGAHCDDIEIGCGGTILRLIDENPILHIKWVVFASNENRKKEAEEAAQLFLEKAPSKEIIIHAYRDAFLPYEGLKIKESFEELKKGFNPDLIFTHYRDDQHQDHRLLSNFTWNTWRNHLIFEYEIPKYDGDLGHPNFFVPLDKPYVDKKIAILLECYNSQHQKHWFDRETFLALMRIRGLEAAASEKHAEAFHLRKMTY